MRILGCTWHNPKSKEMARKLKRNVVSFVSDDFGDGEDKDDEYGDEYGNEDENEDEDDEYFLANDFVCF